MRRIPGNAGATIPTLTHYFGRREDIVAALLAECGRQGAPYPAAAASSDLPLAQGIAALLASIVEG